MVVGCIIDFLANRKLRHRELLLESPMRLYPNKLADRFLAIQLAEFRMTVVVIMSQSPVPEVQFH
jgi:hypothetical protein